MNYLFAALATTFPLVCTMYKVSEYICTLIKATREKKYLIGIELDSALAVVRHASYL